VIGTHIRGEKYWYGGVEDFLEHLGPWRYKEVWFFSCKVGRKLVPELVEGAWKRGTTLVAVGNTELTIWLPRYRSTWQPTFIVPIKTMLEGGTIVDAWRNTQEEYIKLIEQYLKAMEEKYARIMRGAVDEIEKWLALVFVFSVIYWNWGNYRFFYPRWS